MALKRDYENVIYEIQQLQDVKNKALNEIHYLEVDSKTLGDKFLSLNQRGEDIQKSIRTEQDKQATLQR